MNSSGPSWSYAIIAVSGIQGFRQIHAGSGSCCLPSTQTAGNTARSHSPRTHQGPLDTRLAARSRGETHENRSRETPSTLYAEEAFSNISPKTVSFGPKELAPPNP